MGSLPTYVSLKFSDHDKKKKSYFLLKISSKSNSGEWEFYIWSSFLIKKLKLKIKFLHLLCLY